MLQCLVAQDLAGYLVLYSSPSLIVVLHHETKLQFDAVRCHHEANVVRTQHEHLSDHQQPRRSVLIGDRHTIS